ncbi:protein hir-1 [Sporothrix schenckii ATCC 58251]|uniref:Protein HIR n=1 Tax=Sporothrix schenckii (strain ATCC 58251 / de Perez 2211183) TaxID=1391915 RepID=U7PXB3_SPOS1|nr:protein hir-1 [Sporothrix schenckii ATCC 58251]
MHLIKPSWLSHSGEQKDFEVYSCHVSPDGKRLATAGGDGHVRVWSTEAIYNSNNASYTEPRQLCHMSHHLGTIHSVRFSPNGRYLASGADDKIICIYRLEASAPSHTASFGTNEPPPVENWKTYKRLIGHENDVQDLAWSHDSSILVSVGLDSKVVVWSGHTFEKLKTLSVHQSHVKGATFDPANKFFATASDDRTIKIFKFTPPPPNATQHDLLNNFVLETTISAPFKSSPLTTYFRRCSWSPDGNHIAAPNAVNGPVSSVAIIERTRWDSEINLIGHEGPTEVCMFSPRLFYTKKPTPNGEPSNGLSNGNGNNSAAREGESLVTVIASAGQDKTLSIWNTNTSRPLVILQDIASKSISDLAWTPDGQTVFASSLDGSIVVAKFEEGELGWVAQSEETDKALQKFGASRKGMGIAEDVDGLHLEAHSKAGELRGAESRMGALMGDASGASGASTPQPGAATTNGTPPKTKSGSDANANGDAKDGKDGKEDKDKADAAAPAATEPKSAEEETAEKRAERIQTLKSRVTITKDGKKRVAPLLVSSSGTGQSSLPQSQLVGTSSTGKPSQADTPQTILDLSRPVDGLPSGGIASMLLGTKRKAAVVLEGEDDATDPSAKRSSGLTGAAGATPTGPTPILTNGIDGTEPATLQAAPRGIVPTPEFIRPAVISPALSISQVRLGIPKVRAHILRPLEKGVLQGESTPDEASRISENLVFEARNPDQFRDPSHITVTKRGELVWQDFLPKAVLLVTGNKHFWAAACEDGTVYIWTPAGRRLINAMILEAQPVIVECREHWLLCVTAVGLAYVWNVRTMQSPHPPVSLAPILDIAIHSLHQHSATAGPGVTSAHLNSNGHIVVTLSNGDGYYYAPNLYTWQRLSESWWAVGSQYWNSNDSSVSALQTTAVGPVTAADVAANGVPSIAKDASAAETTSATVSSGIIPYLERHTTNEFLLKGRAYTLQRLIKTLLARDGFEGFEASVSIAHLENRIAGALQLGARDEFRLYLFMYAKRLGTEGLRGKVEELLNSLLGGVLQDPTTTTTALSKTANTSNAFGWASRTGDLCGWDRKELLKGVVMILGKFRELQRLTVQYARVLELTNDGDDDADDAGESMIVEA